MYNSGVKIYLNIYDLSPVNYYLHGFGMGLYHSGIQIGYQEYSFGHHEGFFSQDYLYLGSYTGVFTQQPKVPMGEGVTFREQILLGTCKMTQSEMDSAIDKLKSEFIGNSYSLVQRNCNHFSSALCKKLLGRDIPSYVNRLAYLGTAFKCCIPKEYLKGPDTPQETSSFQSQTNKYNNNYNNSGFSGKGVRLGDVELIQTDRNDDNSQSTIDIEKLI